MKYALRTEPVLVFFQSVWCKTQATEKRKRDVQEVILVIKIQLCALNAKHYVCKKADTSCKPEHTILVQNMHCAGGIFLRWKKINPSIL